ncbi:hypothetical protein HK105_209074 [Polyrhizophydium stewartii]|uniref:glucan 1,4-alpha-glucosidase n=1 Tax=Polyrhizophydium stewartii TaxID=2732419 RepID=A0ABR4MW25_9FUNG
MRAFSAVIALIAVPLASAATQSDVYTASYNAFFANSHVSGLPAGTVVAAPSKSNPDYFYHWVRDASVVMAAALDLAKDGAASGSPRQDMEDLLTAYVNLAKNEQNTNTIAGLGEPKFNADGSAFNGAWGRPQNDGPALRALTLTGYANFILANRPNSVSFVKSVMYDGAFPTNSVIKKDLEFVSNGWTADSVDLWEEVSGTQFYTRMVQRTSLINGAKLATTLNDPGAANWYNKQAASIQTALDAHWDSNGQYLRATINKKYGPGAKTSDLDVSVILAALYSERFDKDTAVYPPWNDRVLQTTVTLVNRMKTVYPINSDASLPVVVGRYPEDIYDGIGFSGGNPWPLATVALAEQAYRNAAHYCETATLPVTSALAGYLSTLAKTNVATGTYASSAPQFAPAIKAMFAYGDSVMARTVQLAAQQNDGDVSLSEEWQRSTGNKQGAPKLTWSAVAFMQAVRVQGASRTKCAAFLK